MTTAFFCLNKPRQVLLALILSSSMNAFAVETIAERLNRLESEVGAYHQAFPVRSVDSVARAESAIAEGERLQTNIQSLSTESESACYERFLVNACLDDARHLRRKLQDVVRRVTFEAKAYLRQQRGAKYPKESRTSVTEQ